MNKNQYTVEELKSALEKLPQDALVYIEDPQVGHSYAVEITLDHNEVTIRGSVEEDD